jgi:hypothetical protein
VTLAIMGHHFFVLTRNLFPKKNGEIGILK